MKTINVNRLGTEPIGRLLFNMSSQTTLDLLVYSFYSLTDIFFISRGVGSLAAAGVSRALGSKNVERALRTVANAFMIFWTAAILATIFGLLFLEELIYMMGATKNIAPYVRDYGRIILIGAITSTGYSAIVRADGNIKFSTAMWLIPVGANIVLDPLFIYGFKWGVTGAAIATVAAQAISAGISIYFSSLEKGKPMILKPSILNRRKK